MAMPDASAPVVLTAIFAVAALYASVGHGGASGYLVVLALAGMQPREIASTALALNLAVSGAAFLAFGAAKHFDWRRSWPFILGSAPLAYVGGSMKVSDGIYFGFLAIVLFAAAVHLVWPRRLREDEAASKPVAVPSGMAAGGAIGALSGIVGVGGGIFLSPLMIVCRWATAKQVAATSALFIFFNSLAGLAGRWSQSALAMDVAWPLVLAALAGGVAGSHLGCRTFSTRGGRQALALVLVFAAVKAAFRSA
jgi:uncharacterized membrane protein YfcA